MGMGKNILMIFIITDAFLLIFGGLFSVNGVVPNFFGISYVDGNVTIDIPGWLDSTFNPLHPGVFTRWSAEALVIAGAAIMFGFNAFQLLAVVVLYEPLVGLPTSVINSMGLPWPFQAFLHLTFGSLLVLALIDYAKGGDF